MAPVSRIYGGWAINPKIVQKSCNNILLKSFREVCAYFRGVSAYFLGELVHIFRELVHIFALETSFQISRKKFREIWGHYGNRGFTMILGHEAFLIEITANRWRFESLRTANRDSRHQEHPRFRKGKGTYTPFANRYLPITYFVRINEKSYRYTVADSLWLWIKKSYRYRWAHQCPSPSLSELPKSYRFVIPGNEFQRVTGYRYRFFIILN